MKTIRGATILALVSPLGGTRGFIPAVCSFARASRKSTRTEVLAHPGERAKELRWGWDGTTALGGAVEVARPARLLEDIRASGESIPDECEVFNANLDMSGGEETSFEEVIALIDKYYEYGLIEFKNGDVVNEAGVNEGSAKILSYAALSNLDKAATLKLWGQYYREVLADPDGDSHQNIRNFMKYGWDGVNFDNGIALTKKNVGDSNWDWDAESWIP